MSEPPPTGPMTSGMLMPRSADEAVAAFRVGEAPTVVGGGTIVVPDVRAGRSEPDRALLLARAGLDTITRAGGVISIGACVTLDRRAEFPDPLGSVAAGVADREIRAQATVGGNLCARSPETAPRGDLQAPLVALGARVRLADAHGEATDDVHEFLDRPGGTGLVLALEVEDRERLTGTARLGRPHTHSYTAMHVCAVATLNAGRLTDVRVVAGGATNGAVRLGAVESHLEGCAMEDVEPASAARGAAEGLALRTDTLASAWYREQVLPVLARRACKEMIGREMDDR